MVRNVGMVRYGKPQIDPAASITTLIFFYEVKPWCNEGKCIIDVVFS